MAILKNYVQIKVKPLLEKLSPKFGVTNPVSGLVVIEKQY